MILHGAPLLFLLCSFLAAPLQLLAVSITHLPGFRQGALPFNLETGYVTVDEVYGVEFFYYFVESENSPGEDPLVLWFSGGPGCSSFSAFVLQIGPLKFKSEELNGTLPNLEYNPYTWNKFANIIFLDSPVGAGFSFSHHSMSYDTSDTAWSRHAHEFIAKWLLQHQQFISNPLYIAGDSYAGKIVPIVAQYISEGNELGMHPAMNLQGYMVGNPLTGEDIDFNTRIPFALGMGIISDEFFETTMKSCRGQKYKSPGTALCAACIEEFEGFVSEIMIGHVLDPKCSLASPKPKNKVEERLMLMMPERSSVLWKRPAAPEVRCRSYAYFLAYVWANNPATREVLGIKKEFDFNCRGRSACESEGTMEEWQRCKNLSHIEDVNSSIEYHVNLTTRGYRALVYSGDHDLTIPFKGTKEWIRALNFSVIDKWRSWHVDGQVAGYTVLYSNNLTFATVKDIPHRNINQRSALTWLEGGYLKSHYDSSQNIAYLKC